MNNDELKKKIISALQSVEFVTEKGWCGQCISLRLDYSAIADALIAAGIGDVKDLQVQVDSLEITNIALQAGYDDAEKDRLYWVDKYKEAEHRAEVYKRALHIAHTAGEFAYYVDKAEKELAEERKDEN